MFRLLLLVIYLCIGGSNLLTNSNRIHFTGQGNQLYVVGTISQTVVRGVVGQEITLPCTYNIRDGTNDMCWGRGICPNSKCSNEILHTNGIRVTSRTSSRYQLRGWVRRGDVSLTIVNLKEEDKGLYCCRIEVPGWFNDLKKTLNLQVDRETTTTSQTMATTKSHTVPVTTTSVLLPTTVTPPPTAFFLTTPPPPLAVPTVGPLTTNVPPMTTSSMIETTEFLTSDPPFFNINSSTTGLQITYGYDYYFPTKESQIATSAAGTLLTPKNTENIDNLPISVAAALPITNVSSITTSSTSTAAALLTASPPLVNIKSSSTSLQHESIENGSSHPTEAASAAGIAHHRMTPADNYVAVSCAVVVLVLLLVLLVLIMKRKNIREYQLNRTKSVNKLEEPEKMLIGMEGENGLFAL